MFDGLRLVDRDSVISVTSSSTVGSLAVCAARDDTQETRYELMRIGIRTYRNGV
ncbi:MAG: hypothetical protein QOH88_2884 [Verrucomicrobiota bacterium]|jgi:hypothetical protein